jgi:predicted Zn-dependent peptidase
MRVVVSPDHTVPIVAVNIWYDVGSKDEQPGQSGWAHLFEHLMFQGSANVASGEHLNLLQSVGGSANATTSFDRTNYFETVPTGALDLALWLEADRLATLPDHLTEESIATQQEVVKEERRQRYDNVPYGDSLEHLLKIAFPPDHPYGHSVIGSMADVDSATAETAADFFRQHYLPQNAVISLVGDIKPHKGFKKVEKYFGSIPGGKRVERKPTPPLPALKDIPTVWLHEDVPATSVRWVWRLPKRDTPGTDAAMLALAILADGPTSRLERKLVRELNISTGVSGGVFDLREGTSLGMLALLAFPGVHIEDARKALTAEIQKFCDEGPTKAEVERAKTSALVGTLHDLGRYENRADAFSEYTTMYGDPDRANRRVSELLSLSAKDIHEAANQYLDVAKRGVLLYEVKEDDEKA